MEEKKGVKERAIKLVNNKFLLAFATFVILSFVMVFASDVIVDIEKGSVTQVNNVSVNDRIIFNNDLELFKLSGGSNVRLRNSDGTVILSLENDQISDNVLAIEGGFSDHIQIGRGADHDYYFFENAQNFENPQLRIYGSPTPINDLDWASFRITGGENDLEIRANASNASINFYYGDNEAVAWFEHNVSATGYITRTTVWDSSLGSALNNIRSESQLKDAEGNIDHTAYSSLEKATYTRSIQTGEETKTFTDEDGNKYQKSVPIYTEVIEEGVLLDASVAKHEQAIYEMMIELCDKDNTYSWCN